MKKLITVVAMLVTIGGVASAQGGGAGGMGGGRNMTPEQRIEATMTRLFSGITLSDAQKAKATEIVKKAMDERQGIDRKTPEGMEKMQSIMKKQNDELRELLKSDDDKKKFDENAASGRGRGGQ
ncbi:MAG TPA: hypothetical protein VHE78_09815 [Gemmatimonadaceae bacterium]|nr:hypothetical protein [Gemmatimonadaceae bacterium]